MRTIMNMNVRDQASQRSLPHVANYWRGLVRGWSKVKSERRTLFQLVNKFGASCAADTKSLSNCSCLAGEFLEEAFSRLQRNLCYG